LPALHEGTFNIVTPPLYHGGKLLAVAFSEPTTERQVYMVGTAHIPEANVDTPEIKATHEVLDNFTAVTTGARRRVAFGEGAIPRIRYAGQFYDNPYTRERIVDVDDLAGTIQSDGARGVLLRAAAAEGCTIIGEDDIAIMRAAQFASQALLTHLTLRQMTNYLLRPEAERTSLEGYLDETVIRHYGHGSKIDQEKYSWQLSDAMRYLHDSLEAAQITIDDEAAMQHFKGQALIEPIAEQVAAGGILNEHQMVAEEYNRRRDTALMHNLFDDWGEPAAPHKVAVFGIPHLHTIVGAAHDRGIVSTEAYERYIMAAQKIGQRALRWRSDGRITIEADR